MKRVNKDYTNYVFFVTYYLSFILLLFEIRSSIEQMNGLEKIFGDRTRLYLAIIIISIIFLTLVFLFQYFILKLFIKDGKSYDALIAISLLLTDTLLFVGALLGTFLFKNIINIIPIINIIIGPLLFYFLLKGKLSRRDAIVAAMVKLIFYLTNIPLLFG